MSNDITTECQDANSGMNGESPELSAIVAKLEASYWVPSLRSPLKGLEELRDGAQTGCPPIYGPLSAFITNLKAAIELLEFPYFVLRPSALHGTHLRGKLLSTAADQDWGTRNEDKELANAVVVRVFEEVERKLRERPEPTRLMQQACLLIWGALETYCKEAFIYSLNVRPGLFANLQKVPALKERFSISQERWLPLLQARNFDLNGCLGNVVAGDKDFSSPQLLRDVFGALYAGMPSSTEPGIKLLASFKDEALWRLGQRRHLIAHKCGVVDDAYIDKTKDSAQSVGQVLKLRGRDVAEGMSIAAQCAVALSYWVNQCGKTIATESEPNKQS